MGLYDIAIPCWHMAMMRAIFLLVAAVLLGVGGGYAWSQWSKPSAADKVSAQAVASAKPGSTAGEVQQSEYYADCAAVAKAGKQPLWAGQPGYREELDPEHTGIACPPGAGS